MKRAVAFALVLGLATPARAADPDPWFGADKGLHFAATSGLAIGGYDGASLFTTDRRVRLAVGAGFSLTAGVAKELWDLAGHGTPSWKDLTWDAIGCAVGLAVAWLVDRFVLSAIDRLRAERPSY